MRGQITVFFSLIVTLILSLIVVCIQGAIKSTIAMQTECVVDMGLDSVFAEYHRELLEQYELFLIDTSYGVSNPSIANTENHLLQYMEYNVDPQKGNLIMDLFDWNQMEIVDAMITDEIYATDQKGYEIKKQAISYMKNRIGMDEIEYIKDKVTEINQDGLLERELDLERQELRDSILKEEEKVNEENLNLDQNEMNQEEIIQENQENQNNQKNQNQNGKFFMESETNSDDNSIQTKGERARLGILSMVIKDTSVISRSELCKEELLSSRIIYDKKEDSKENQEGNKKDREVQKFDMSEEVLFVEYLLSQFHSYVDVEEYAGALSYEVEYLLGGKETDVENLKKVVHSMLLMREVANYMYLLTDQEKMGEADALAWTFGVVTLNPEMQPAYKQLILLSWAYGEGLLDVRKLLEGGKVPLKKTRENWQLGIDNMFQIGLDLVIGSEANKDDGKNINETNGNTKYENEDDETGLDYKMYLRLLLLVENKEDVLTRSMNLIEANIRKTEGNSEFRLDGCIGGMSANVEMKGKFGFDFVISRKYYYCNS